MKLQVEMKRQKSWVVIINFLEEIFIELKSSVAIKISECVCVFVFVFAGDRVCVVCYNVNC